MLEETNGFEVEEICALLTTKACPKTKIPQLELNPRLRKQVKERLQQAGYEFVDDPFSNHYDARIQRQIRSMNDFLEEQLGGADLTVQSKAIIAILWCNLVLPLYDPSVRGNKREEPVVTEDQLYENFKSHIGARQNLRKILTVLRQYDFIRTVWGRNEIKAGPRLTTAIDCTLMYERLQHSLIDFLIDDNAKQREEVGRLLQQHIDTLEQEVPYGEANG